MSEHQQMQQSGKPDSTFQKQAALISQHVSHPASIIQRARIDPKSLTAADVLQLQRTIGNRAVGRLLSEIRNPSKVQQAPIQRQETPEEEEPLQGKFGKEPEEETCPSCVQRQEIPEEEPLQGKFETIQRLEPEEEEQLQMKSVVQRQESPEEEEPIQGKMIGTIQRQEIPEEEPLQKKSENNTGMPDNLKAGVENLSGIDMSDVRVHYNSNKPAQVGALAYTQGTNIHVAPGQERHLPHEAWHVVQQMQGRVKPTMQLQDRVSVNDDEGLEKEADMMGGKAVKELIAHKSTHVVEQNEGTVTQSNQNSSQQISKSIVQRYDLIPFPYVEDLANGRDPEEKLDGPNDPPLKRRRGEEEPEGLGGKRQHLEIPIQPKCKSGKFVLSQKKDSIQRSENEQTNLWARTVGPDHEVPFWGGFITSSENGSLVIQTKAVTRNKGVQKVFYKGQMAGGGGGGHPPVPRKSWQQKVVNGINYKFWNEGDGTLEFTAPTKVGAGPALPSKSTINIDAGGGKLIHTGRSLKNTRYQHFLAANIAYEGINPPVNGGNSPPKYTWHHHKNQGIMELIDRDVHAAFGHHGGFSIWGS